MIAYIRRRRQGPKDLKKVALKAYFEDMSFATAAALAQAQAKLYPPSLPLTSKHSPVKYSPCVIFDSIVLEEISLSDIPPAVISAFS